MTSPSGALPLHTTDCVLRPLASDDDYKQCVALQQLTWGEGFNQCVPTAVLQIAQKVGGVAAGAFDEHDQLVGFVFGVSGFRNGRAAHWSHMLAVRPERRGTGIGAGLKALQRDLLLKHGIEVAYWTYDPLVSANAHLNINRLGARPVEYVPDMYGSDTGSELHSGLGTDRFIVEWVLDDAGVIAAMTRAANDQPRGPDESTTPIVNLDERSLPTTAIRELGDPIVRVAIPPDIQHIKHTAPVEAHAWRASTRRAFEWHLARDYRVTGFRRDSKAGAGHYTLTKQESSQPS